MGNLSKKTKALVVDDNEVNLIVARELLECFGVIVDTVPGGSEALAKLESADYDLVFMDQMMPVMDGAETTKRIRAMGKELPVIALTANDVTGTEDWYLDSGMNDHLNKPIDFGQLEELLERWGAVRHEPVNSAADEPDCASDVIAILGKRCGIDAKAAACRMGMSERSYLTVVNTFYKKLKDTACRLQSCLDSGDLEAFRIEVHGCKSALMNIGAEEQSELARKLELAAMENDADFIRDNNGVLLEQLEALHQRLTAEKALFDGTGESSKTSGNRQELLEKLKEMDALLEDLDNDAAGQILMELMAYSYGGEIDACLNKVRDCIDDFDYDGAAGYILQILTL